MNERNRTIGHEDELYYGTPASVSDASSRAVTRTTEVVDLPAGFVARMEEQGKVQRDEKRKITNYDELANELAYTGI